MKIECKKCQGEGLSICPITCDTCLCEKCEGEGFFNVTNQYKVGQLWRAKKPRAVNTFACTQYDDREIIWVSPCKTKIQYDSPAIRNGRKYPIVFVERFDKWAGEKLPTPPKN